MPTILDRYGLREWSDGDIGAVTLKGRLMRLSDVMMACEEAARHQQAAYETWGDEVRQHRILGRMLEQVMISLANEIDIHLPPGPITADQTVVSPVAALLRGINLRDNPTEQR